MVLPQATIMIVGSLHMDSIYQVHNHIRPHDHVNPKGITMPGGHGGNQAVACRRMSRHKPVEGQASVGPIHERQSNADAHDIEISVYMVGMVGNDKDGLRVKEALTLNGVNIDDVKTTDEESTGTAHITVDRFGEAIVISDAKANDKLTSDIIPDLSQPLHLLLVQLEVPIETTQYVIQLAREQQPPVPVILNPAPAPDPGTQIPRDLYQVDYLIVNAQQACKLRGHGNKDAKARKPLDFEADCRHFHHEGARCVIITLGERGAIASEVERHRSNRVKITHHPALQIQEGVKDETGASDAFIGAFAVEILRQKKSGEKEDVVKAMEWGIMAGACAVAKLGSLESVPWRDEVLEREGREDGFDGVVVDSLVEGSVGLRVSNRGGNAGGGGGESVDID
ncbi:uncharacterized protein PAC_14404 [Phialocephala subalpina]|uniref:Ribokinase n=1 Tax=Phialocephala subalpina TaxID=576137 RepID=A0A1L7XHR9_9HELO|nr:uncharacterized protein PAC_14404 [Phialocephala subalpina]